MVVELEDKTPAGNDMVEVAFEDGTKEQMPKARFELIATDEVMDPAMVLAKIKARVGAILFGTLHEYGVKWGEVNGMSDAMIDLVNNGFKKASDLKWGFEKEMIPLIEVNKVLITNYARNKENDNGAGSTGSGPDSENKG